MITNIPRPPKGAFWKFAGWVINSLALATKSEAELWLHSNGITGIKVVNANLGWTIDTRSSGFADTLFDVGRNVVNTIAKTYTGGAVDFDKIEKVQPLDKNAQKALADDNLNRLIASGNGGNTGLNSMGGGVPSFNSTKMPAKGFWQWLFGN